MVYRIEPDCKSERENERGRVTVQSIYNLLKSEMHWAHEAVVFLVSNKSDRHQTFAQRFVQRIIDFG